MSDDNTEEKICGVYRDFWERQGIPDIVLQDPVEHTEGCLSGWDNIEPNEYLRDWGEDYVPEPLNPKQGGLAYIDPRADSELVQFSLDSNSMYFVKKKSETKKEPEVSISNLAVSLMKSKRISTIGKSYL